MKSKRPCFFCQKTGGRQQLIFTPTMPPEFQHWLVCERCCRRPMEHLEAEISDYLTVVAAKRGQIPPEQAADAARREKARIARNYSEPPTAEDGQHRHGDHR